MSRLSPDFWDAALLPVSSFLADMRAFTLDRSHTRLPKWKFRLADDLVVQIQPKPGERRRVWDMTFAASMHRTMDRAFAEALARDDAHDARMAHALVPSRQLRLSGAGGAVS